MENLPKSKISHLRKITQKKIRRITRTAIIEGEKLIGEAIDHDFAIEHLVYRQGLGKDLQRYINDPMVKAVYKTDESSMKRISELDTNPGLLAEVHIPIPKEQPGINATHMQYLILDKLSDPNNLGAIIRTASWYGLDGIICSNSSAEILNSKAIRASMGSVFHLPIWENVDLYKFIPNLIAEGFKIFAAVPRDGQELLNIKGRSAILIGSESFGISPNLLQLCSELITIPGRGRMESLNAAVSAGILMDRIYGR